MISRVRKIIRTQYSLESSFKIIRNIGWLSIDNFLRLGVSLIVGVWVARYFGPEKFGLWSYVLAFISLFGSLATLGLDSVVIREIVKNPLKRNIYVGTSFFIMGSTAILLLFIIPITGLIVRGNDRIFLYLVAIVSSGLLFKSLNSIDFYFQSRVLSKYTVIAKNIGFLVSSIGKVILILSDSSIIMFAFANVFEFVITGCVLIWFYLKNNESIGRWRFDFDISKSLLSDSWPLILSGIIVMVYMRIDQIMLGSLLGDVSVGLYSAAVRISEIAYFIPIAIASSVYPSLIKAKETNNKLYKSRLKKLYSLMVLLSALIGIVTYFLAPFIIKILFGIEYIDSIGVLRIHIWAAIFVFIGVANNKTYMIIENYSKVFLFTSTFGAISNIVLNIYMIPRYGIFGAAYATLAAQAIAFFSQIFILKVRDNFIVQLKCLFLLDLYDIIRKVRGI